MTSQPIETGTGTYLAQQRQTINTFKALMKLPVPKGQKYAVWAYALIDDPTHQKIAMVIPLGNYSSKEEALERASFVLKTTQHKGVFVSPMNNWQELTTEEQINRDEHLVTSVQDKLMQLHLDEKKKEYDILLEKQKIEEELLKEKALELDPITIDHYIHHWYMAIVTWQKLQMLNKDRDDMFQSYMKHITTLRKQYQDQPQFEKEWPDVFKQRLTKRNETALFEGLMTEYEHLKKEIQLANPTPLSDEVVLNPVPASTQPDVWENLALSNKDIVSASDGTRDMINF